MTPLQVKEINRIHAAVDDFASAMKTRLTQKWEDSDGCPSDRLIAGMCDDANNRPTSKAVDIANRAMMLWHRANDEVERPLKAGKGENE